ncbi:hypothetical protein CQW23_18883 [Capsicum baccatum]|uniref:Uncharacterized protein n=1 Tax=Capsicum baccatum TaxID=33114 RepID=A0A2G2W4B7_CAPBA|nr:hypothetical protein CQW23_18883 [Capsicum baccatum]
MIWYETHRERIKALFGALALLTVGKAGRDVTLKAFLADQLWRSKEEQNLEEDEELIEIRQKLIWGINWILGIIVATVWLSTIEWEALAKICTITMVAAFSVFLLGIPFYEHKALTPSPILYIFNVVKAANLKRHLDYPVSPSQLFKNYSTSDTQILPHIPFLRWLDKAAIVEPSPPCPVSTEQAETAGRLFEVAKVRDVKRLISMLPLWSSFFVYSLVETTASTFFYVQADFMNDHLGKTSPVPIVVFVIIKTSTSSIVEIICELLKRKGSAPRRPPLYRVVLGMLCSFFCCLTAWRVEVYRRGEQEVWLDDYNTERYTNKISVFWLTPTSWLALWMDFRRVGSKISLKLKPWFKEDVNKSRLDKYYAMLMVPTFLNFCFCWFVSNWYANQQPHDIDMDINIAQELGDVAQEVLINHNSGFDIAHQELEDGPVEIVTNYERSTPSINN